jgi:hypothetical protein
MTGRYPKIRDSNFKQPSPRLFSGVFLREGVKPLRRT